jgi:hypothetical protein
MIMATTEFLTKRVEGKKAEIEKLEKKLARIIKAEESNWENNPYYYSKDDKKWTLKHIDDAKKALADYEAQLEVENNKASSRNVQVIIDFLNNWKAKSMEYYEEMLPKYLDGRKEYYRIERECTRRYNDSWNIPVENRKAEREEIRRIRDKADKNFNSTWGWIMPYVIREYDSNHEFKEAIDTAKLEKDLNIEADRKYDFIIERTNEIVTKITDASNLYIGNSGELNGYIIGTTGVANVNTIGAGGYNIQRFHFRTLIHRVK